MPSYVLLEKCAGCKGKDKTACQYICPNDLMVLNKDTMKAYNRDPSMCWECYNCVKICPQQAVAVRAHADFVPLGASVTPLRGTQDIIWAVKFRNQSLKRFKFRTRTVAEGSVEVSGGFKTAPEAEDLKSPLLFTEPESPGVPELPTIQKVK